MLKFGFTDICAFRAFQVVAAKVALNVSTPFLLPFFMLFQALAPGFARAEGLSTFEYVAFVDSNIELCQRVKPQSAAQFELLRNPPYACAPRDLSIENLARSRLEYKEFRQKLKSEFSPLTSSERIEYCDSLFQTKC